MNDQLVHIFDNSTCLTKRQLKDYVTGVMGDEECHAAEVHLNSCPFCSDAADGMMMHKDEAAQLLAELNSDFLKEHFAQSLPQVHLNAIAVPANPPAPAKKKNNTRPFWRTASVAATLLFCTGVAWYYSYQKDSWRNGKLAQDVPAANDAVKPAANMPPVQSDQHIAPGNNQGAGVPQQPVTQVPVVPAHKEADKDQTAQPQPANALRTEAPAAVTAQIAADTLTGSIAAVPRTSAAPGSDARLYGNSFQNYNVDQNRGFANTSIMRFEDASGKSKEKKLAYTTARPAAAPAADNKPETAPTATAAKQVTEPPGYTAEKTNADRAEERKKDLADKTDDADELYDKGNYRSALAAYNRDISSSNRSRRHYAAMGAARCYINLGQKAKARQLLQNIVNEGGAQSRAARRLLRKMDETQ